MKNKPSFIIVIMMISLLALTACGSGSATQPAASETEAANAPVVETAAVATESATASCPVGKWALTDFTSYILSMQQNLTSMTNNEYTFSNTSYTGSANFEYKEDQTAVFSADHFVENFTMSVNVSGTQMDIPIKIDINGTSTANYSISGDKITYSDQDAGDLSVIVDVMGTSSTMDEGFFGQPGSTQLYQFACPDASTLTLKVIAVQDMDLAPLSLTRIN